MTTPRPRERPADTADKGTDSPATRYAAARWRSQFPQLADFSSRLSFDLDDFQIEACQGLERGSGVLVCAPTGAGKTIVGEFAVHLALSKGRKCFYTTPIKALSNQKFHDLVAVHGADKVGLLTGDTVINGEAPVVVMTTEVLRNMLYARSATLEGLGFVVMDEVHYLADRFRGAVWEEVIIHLPASVSLVSLSATVSNAEEFADWLVSLRGHTEVVVSEHRPVPLWQHIMVGRRLFDLFATEGDDRTEVHPQLMRHIREQERRLGYDRRGRMRRPRPPYRSDVIAKLDSEALLPAIVFIFSRAACDAAVSQCLLDGLRLTDPGEEAEIARVANARVAHISTSDLNALGYYPFLDGLQRGLAAHHAGLLPVFKEIVEELFAAGLVKVVFATETLALGINMPARTVVLERLVKYNGEEHVDLTPGEYTQLTGRAGRRGIDIEGHAVTIWGADVDPRHVAGLASTRTYPLNSSFSPSYNMAINLIATLGTDKSRELLSSSFAQFQADRTVVGLAEQARAARRAAGEFDPLISCDRGDFEEYFALRMAATDREKRASRQRKADARTDARASLARLRVGDVIRIPAGRRAGLAVVLDPGLSRAGRDGEQRPLVLTEARWAGRLAGSAFPQAVEALARIKVPKHFNHRNPALRRDLSAALRAAAATAPGAVERGRRRRAGDDPELEKLRAQLRAHPCHECPDVNEHARQANRRQRLLSDYERLQTKVNRRSGSLARTFDRVRDMLSDYGYIASGTVTDAGRVLSRIWSESDLLVAECVREGVWDGLSAPELAAVASIVLYESRRDADMSPALPKGNVASAVAATLRRFDAIHADESRHGLSLTGEPDLGFVWPMYRWARGEPLAKVLAAGDGPDGSMPAGDFVRWARQTIDLLGQLASAAGPSSPLYSTALAAADAVRRGVVADS
ncbi:DEAD/DEAH box helicase [Stackebrandtia nassauensis]|uniref:DEAD/DEAH box helicase domain protein n=1 Tax=Stackebrandtia nassauensis (strain DSM 44728 / CIP 108903 / NRRL B-16338 / NBRC 102104 / LLR-40K-21) TaxID=446470 RepID=D3QBF6_STANL|nr:DEAD/DEAH box helicase [Stackebrandtia nassauensis]ADD42838.1 DEAD/DEAH box helicase domain protein [Stackebrandtia nassauensis DSM 44728]